MHKLAVLSVSCKQSFRRGDSSSFLYFSIAGYSVMLLTHFFGVGKRNVETWRQRSDLKALLR